jgi:hypothetical protein
MSNTHPNTPFGKFFNKIGIWHPDIEDAIKDAYEKLHYAEKEAVNNASGWIAVINSTLYQAPDIVFEILQKKYPGLKKETITDFLNNLNAKIHALDDYIPDTFEAALIKLQDYLSKYEGHTWAVITKAAVSIGTDILLIGASPIQAIEIVIEYVYQEFIKPKVA